MSIEFQNGTQITIEGAQYVQYAYDARVEILGTKGIIQLGDLYEKRVLACTKSGGVARPSMRSWTYLFHDAYLREDIAFVEAIVENREVECKGIDGKMAVKIVREGNRSIREHKIIEL